ncbi:unnamed protein product [Amaranthus hypochondriacus]
MIAEKLAMSIVGVSEKELDRETLESIVADLDLAVVGFSSLSATKVVIFLEDEDTVAQAMEKSTLKQYFTELRRWSKEDGRVNRLLWLECRGVPPMCCSEDNFQKIGEVWGKVIRVVAVFNGINSLTSARLLVETTVMHRIEERINVKWETGSSTVWVNEIEKEDCEGSDFEYVDESDDESNSSDEQDHIENTPGDENRRTINMGRKVEDQDGNTSGAKNGISMETANDETRVGSEDMMEVEEYRDDMAISSRMDRLSQQEECMVTPQAREEVQRMMSNSLPSVDDCWGGAASCPAQAKEVDWFDPIATIEAPMSQGVSADGGLHISRATNPGRRPRGRPKRTACSLPDTLSVPSTPLMDSLEANNTWHTATKLGVGCRSVSAVHEELRRSKRIQVLEYSTPGPSR